MTLGRDNVVYFFRRVFRFLRVLVLKLSMGKKIELTDRLRNYNLSYDTHLRIEENGKMILGAFSTESNVHLSARSGIIRLGTGCKINRNCIIVAKKSIQIGENTVIAPNVCLYDHDHSFNECGIVAGVYKESPIVVGRNVWIGAGTIILRGTTIGDHSVIGAGCVIHGAIPKNSLVTSASRELHIKQLVKTQ